MDNPTEKEVAEALAWADHETDKCFSSGTGHSDAKVLAKSLRQARAELAGLLKQIEFERNEVRVRQGLLEKAEAECESLRLELAELDIFERRNHDGMLRSAERAILAEAALEVMRLDRDAQMADLYEAMKGRDAAQEKLAQARKEIEIAHVEHEGEYPTPCTAENCHLMKALSILDQEAK